MRFLLIANANKDKGMGHLFRQLTIGKRLCEEGALVIFLSENEHNRKIVEKYGICFNVCRFSDRDALFALLKKYEITDAIIDLTEEDYSRLSYLSMYKKIRIISFIVFDYSIPRYEDVCFFPGAVDCDGFIYGHGGKKVKCFSGFNYVVIKEDFQNLPPKKIRQDASAVLISMGGSDPFDLTEFVLRDFCKSKIPALNITVVIGSKKEITEELQEIIQCANNYHDVVLKQDVFDMAQEMQSADLAIISGGITRYELIATATPFITIAIHEKQKKINDFFAYEIGIVNLGVWDQISEGRIFACVENILGDWDRRVNMSQRMRNIFDRKGLDRVVEILMRRRDEKNYKMA